MAVNSTNGIIKYIVDPFNIIISNKPEFFIWFMFAILGGQLGILCNLIIRFFAHDKSIISSIYLDSSNGNFYTFSIALCASSLGPLFTSFMVDKDKLQFSRLKIITISCIIFFLIFSSVIYAAVQSKVSTIAGRSMDYEIDFFQLIVYLTAVFIAMYSYCLIRISLPGYGHLEEAFHELHDEDVQGLELESRQLDTDGAGVKI